MTIKDYCQTHTAIARQQDSVLEAAARMQRHHVGALVVVERNEGRDEPVGMVTDRDIVVNGLARCALAGEDPAAVGRLRVADVMSRDVVVAREDEPLPDVIRGMKERGIRRIPVVDHEGALVGIFAFDDFIQVVADEMTDLATLIVRERRREEARTQSPRMAGQGPAGSAGHGSAAGEPIEQLEERA